MTVMMLIIIIAATQVAHVVVVAASSRLPELIQLASHTKQQRQQQPQVDVRD